MSIPPPAQRLTIIGVGLIGGSLARALRREHPALEVVGCGRQLPNLRRALELGVIDRYETDPARAVQDADMVVVAVPVGSIETVFAAIAGHLAPEAVVTDVGSTKGNVVTAAYRRLGERLGSFVPGHPIAGTERSGVEAAFAELFEGCRVILTPLPETDRAAVERVRALWRETGARVSEMDVRHHDAVLAATSHLPHLLAYTLVDSLASMDDSEEIFGYAAGGFRDFTRIASSDPALWRDICLANRDALLETLQRFSTDLSAVADAIQKTDGEALMKVFGRAKEVRDRFAARGKIKSPE
ncbi:MAG: prephenate dehydrogenase/arogenate dehydrogenase family protein [Gammaproteobacteria bacterium]|nr:prephenate dehydrogenase/arogenate dehydrogenase family protein [Gammaproteobacteria bacterium]